MRCERTLQKCPTSARRLVRPENSAKAGVQNSRRGEGVGMGAMRARDGLLCELGATMVVVAFGVVVVLDLGVAKMGSARITSSTSSLSSCRGPPVVNRPKSDAPGDRAGISLGVLGNMASKVLSMDFAERGM